jgi:thiol-disulfide isomerase/thioredoxin
MRELDLETVHLGSSKLSELLGKPAPEFSGIVGWKNGEPVTLEQLRGKVVILDFWSYACSICIAEMPKLFPIQQKYRNNPDLVIIAVHSPIASSLEEAYAKCAVARAKLWPGGELPFRVALDSSGKNRRSGTMASLGVAGVPTTILIDRDGNVSQRFWHAGVPGFAEAVDRLMKTPAGSVAKKRASPLPKD